MDRMKKRRKEKRVYAGRSWGKRPYCLPALSVNTEYGAGDGPAPNQSKRIENTGDHSTSNLTFSTWTFVS